MGQVAAVRRCWALFDAEKQLAEYRTLSPHYSDYGLFRASGATPNIHNYIFNRHTISGTATMGWSPRILPLR